MKFAVAATLIATASAFSVNKADLGKVRLDTCERKEKKKTV